MLISQKQKTHYIVLIIPKRKNLLLKTILTNVSKELINIEIDF